MSDQQMLHHWKDPEAGPDRVDSPVGTVELTGLTGGIQADTLLPWFCEKTFFQGTCAMGPTLGCC